MSFINWLVPDRWRDGGALAITRNFRFEIQQNKNAAGDISGRVLVRRSGEWKTCGVVQLLADEWQLLKLVLEEYDVEITHASPAPAVPVETPEA